MRVRSLLPFHFILGAINGILEVEAQGCVENHKTYMINGVEYCAQFFEVINDLPEGWYYCACGTTTSNKSGICCGCRK
jgi:hypothetical protein